MVLGGDASALGDCARATLAREQAVARALDEVMDRTLLLPCPGCCVTNAKLIRPAVHSISSPSMEKLILVAAHALALAPTTAYAYLDPGTGSFILQMLIAGLLGAILYVRLAWDRTRQFFARLFSRRPDQTDANGESSIHDKENVNEDTK